MSDLDGMRRHIYWLWFAVAIILVLEIVDLANGDDVVDAKADVAKIKEDVRGDILYFSLGATPEEDRERLLRVLNFVVSSCTQLQSLDVLFEVSPTLWRTNRKMLGWPDVASLVASDYPYGDWPQCIRADWWVRYLTDQTLSGGLYHHLLFGKPITTSGEFAAALGVRQLDKKDPEVRAFVEVASNVNQRGTRLIEGVPAGWHALFTTFDSSELNSETDPIENLAEIVNFAGRIGAAKTYKPEASEFIGAIPKEVGLLQCYALANAAGAIQAAAPTDIVQDDTYVFGSPEIRNWGSCVACHSIGLNPFSQDGVAVQLKSGAKLYETKRGTLASHFGSDLLLKEMLLWNAAYAEAVQAITKWSPQEMSRNFMATIADYDAHLTLDRAASEVYLTGEKLKIAIQEQGVVTGRLAALANGEPIPRRRWEDDWRVALDRPKPKPVPPVVTPAKAETKVRTQQPRTRTRIGR